MFHRKPPKKSGDDFDAQSALVEMLLDADEVERKRLLLMALQSGELKMSEASEIVRLVERLEKLTGKGPHGQDGQR